ncbi:hypothetical protein PHYBOEH_006765 [Phytophthora boehmeriae]|uniref:Uncharacterized protein n=1 Tax=Phytophthora boehmeriae TaxID=109152 RepID=A0A8T1WGI5_9STRA|nr:hypothetical protein PHYBOEH_006765 [Phytophthora boehmeriae]
MGFDDMHEVLLRARPDEPRSAVLQDERMSLSVQRELGCILAVFSPDRLALRVIGTVTVLKRLLARYLALEEHLPSKKKNIVAHDLEVQAENAKLRSDYKLLGDHMNYEIANFLKEKARLKETHRSEVKKVYPRNAILERDLKASRFSIRKLMNFLNRHTKLLFQWPRLEELFTCFANGLIPPAHYNTLLSVQAQDDPSVSTVPYVPSDDKGDVSASGNDKSGGGGGPSNGGKKAARTLNLVRGPASGSIQSTPPKPSRSKGKSYGKSRQSRPDEIQLRPSEHVASERPCRKATCKLLFTEDEARAKLDVGVLSKNIRLDVRCAMQTGISTKEDREAHVLFHEDSLVQMLASMIYWNRMDETPWAKYVPDRYFDAAENRLEDFEAQGSLPPKWPSLPNEDVAKAEVEVILLDSDPGNYPDDKAKDEDYVNDPSVEIEDDNDDDEDEPPTTPRSQRNKRRLSGGRSLAGHPDSKRARLARRSPLAKKSYEDQTPADIAVIESLAGDMVSWRHYGVRMVRGNDSAHVDSQAAGFPDYAPNQNIEYLKQRWDESAYVHLTENI